MIVPNRLIAGASLSLSMLLLFIALPSAKGDSPLLAPPMAGYLSQPDMKVSKRKNGPYRGEDQYRGKQRHSVTIKRRPVTSYFTVENDGAMNRPGTLFRLKGGKGTRLVSSKYYNERGRNISASIFRGRYTVNLPTDTEAVIKQKIALSKKSRGKRLKKSFPVTARNTANAALKDTAEVQVRKKK